MEMDDFTQLVQSVNGLLWGMYCLIPLLVGTGIYLTIKLRFIQIRRFGHLLDVACRILRHGYDLC